MNHYQSTAIAIAPAGVGFLVNNDATAQSGGLYTMRWSNIGNGGQTFANGGFYRLGGTSGQADAGRLAGGFYVVEGGFWNGEGGGTVDVEPPDTDPAGETLPVAFAMRRPTPNPFRGTSTLAFDLPSARPVSLAIYGIDGRVVRRLAAGPYEAGRYFKVWDGRDDAGRAVASGIYFARIVAGDFQSTHRVVRFQ
jgi:hypothetical protein